MVNRKVAVIVVWLVPEAREKSNEEIAKEIQEELTLDPIPIPYVEKIGKVTVLSEGDHRESLEFVFQEPTK